MTSSIWSSSRRRATVAAVLWLVTAIPLQLRAQVSDRLSLPVGTRVRIVDTVGPQVFTGNVLRLASDTLALAVGGGSTLVRLPISRFASIEVSEGRDRLRAGVIGAGVGLLAGGVLGAATLGRDQPEDLGAFVGFIAGGVLGSGIGALMGVILAPERWRDIPHPSLRR